MPLTLQLTGKKGKMKECKKKRIVWNEKSIKEFREWIIKEGEREAWEDLKISIKNALPWRSTKGKEVEDSWWDKECAGKKKEVKSLLEKARIDGTWRRIYITERKKYRRLIAQKKEVEGKRKLEKIKKDKTQKAFWDLGNSKRKSKREEPEDRIKREEWIGHFKKLLVGKTIDQSNKKEEVRSNKIEEGDEISEREIEEAIDKLKKKKAPGEDEIPNEAWIFGKGQVTENMKRILNRIWKGETFPEEWKSGIIIPLYKKGKKEEVGNYRGITLLDTGYKMHTEILRKRIEEDLEAGKKLNETQMGFRKNRGTIDAIYILKSVIEAEMKKDKGKVFMFFADMRAAFDKIKREEV